MRFYFKKSYTFEKIKIAMPIRLPKANTAFNTKSVTDLATYAQAIHDGLLASIATYPTPPVLPAALATLITTYNTAYTASIDGSKLDTANFHAAKFALINALRQDAAYVNYITYNLVAGGMSYSDAQALILATGYVLSKDPVPAGPLPGVDVRSWGSPAPGQLKLILEKVPNAKGYQIVLADLTANTGVILTFPSTRILITGLISGHTYQVGPSAIGANPTRTVTHQVTQVII